MLLYLTVVFGILSFTRFLSYWGFYTLQEESVEIIKGGFGFTYVENTGAAFGIFQDKTMALSVFSIIVALGITVYLVAKKKENPIEIIPLGLVVGGGLANVLDRLTYGFVIDYFDFRLINYPVFNFADVCIVVGCIWIFINVLLEKDEKTEEKKDF